MSINATMLLRIKGDYTEEQTLKLAVKAYECFGKETFWLPEDRTHHCITRTREFTQDGDTIYPKNNETLLDVHLWGRYYGINYERGHLPDYIMLAEFFEQIIPDVEVWYGGDSSGITAYPFNKAVRQTLFKHFCRFSHSPYKEYFDKEKDIEMCELCKRPLIRNGWGPSYKAWYCPSCPKRVVEKDGVKSIQYKEIY